MFLLVMLTKEASDAATIVKATNSITDYTFPTAVSIDSSSASGGRQVRVC